MAQDFEIPEGYTVDTLLRESDTHPGVFDTIITYKKVNIVHREVLVEDTTASDDGLLNWQAGLTGGYAFGIGEDIITYNNSGVSVPGSEMWSLEFLLSAKINHWTVSSMVGISGLQQEWNHAYYDMETQPVENTFSDTVDVFYVENESGEQVPHYVIKERNETLTDTTVSELNSNFNNSVTFLQAGVSLGYQFVVGQWLITPGVGYSLAVPISSQGTSISNENTYHELTNEDLASLVHNVGLGLSLGYSVSPAVEIFLTADYTTQLNPLYKTHGVTYDFIGVQGGLSFNLN